MERCNVFIHDLQTEEKVDYDFESIRANMNVCKCGAVPIYCVVDNGMLEISCNFCGNKANRKYFQPQDIVECIKIWDSQNNIMIEVKEETIDGNKD